MSRQMKLVLRAAEHQGTDIQRPQWLSDHIAWFLQATTAQWRTAATHHQVNTLQVCFDLASAAVSSSLWRSSCSMPAA